MFHIILVSSQTSQDVEAFSALLMATGRATKPEATQIVLEEAIHRFGNPVEISNFRFWFVIYLFFFGVGGLGGVLRKQKYGFFG